MNQKRDIKIIVEDKKIAGFILREDECDKSYQNFLMSLYGVEICDVYEESAKWEKIETELSSENEKVEPVK